MGRKINLTNIHHENNQTFYKRVCIINLEKEIKKLTFKFLKEIASKMIVKKEAKIYETLINSLNKHTKYFVLENIF